MTSSNAAAPSTIASDDTALAEGAVALVEDWLVRAAAVETAADRATLARLQGVISDPAGVAFAMQFVDRVIRPEDHRTSADQLVALVGGRELPGFLSPLDKLLLRAGARLAPIIPMVVIPLAVRRMRQLVGHLVVDAEPGPMARHLGAR
jgi:RHH-type proline utilization regulon transcriptional repressor/proline dehydrogenase/delta 1-pyrroline-5-carboxylate dehydrogenase